jgi:pyridinium-3,5-bisthiocarboxylic acid mononucleotide nickel chelatase
MRIGYLECFSGISGDMLLGALLDAGVPFTCLQEAAASLNVGAHLEMRKVSRGGLAATKVDVLTETQQTHAHHRSLSAILKIIHSAPLTATVKERSIRAFQLLGEAEAAIHSIPIESVHFHELGAVDTIIDIVCAAAGCEQLGVDRWLSSSLNVGSGVIECQHGTLPVPAPATLALLGDAPIYSAGEPMERVTPTGAAILRMLNVAYQPLPSMRVKASGYGSGTKETPETPNLLRLLVGETAEELSDQLNAVPIAVIETVIDDSNPQLISYTSDLLLAAGAWDVYHVAVQMKKGRTGIALTVLCRPDLVTALCDILFRETTTIGLRWRLENKLALSREFLSVQTPWGAINIKIARWPNGTVANAAPEYEDCSRLATEHSLPLKQVMQHAMQSFAAIEATRNSGQESA